MSAPMALDDLDDAWILDAQLAILRLAMTELYFTAEDLRRILRPAPVANWVGIAFTTAKKAGLIEPIGYETSNAPSRKHGVLRQWRRKPNEGFVL